MDKIKVGIVGCGGVAQTRHIPGFLKLGKKVELRALCDTNATLAHQTATRMHIPGAYSGLSEMLSSERLDLVDICAPPQTHASLAVQALEAGCHVLMEKPMALSVPDCDEMISTSHRHERKFRTQDIA